ncbi:MAG: sulfurtransferase [Acidimicrobiales bacterium]
MLPPVVGLSWVEKHRHELVLADVRWYLDGRSGRDAFALGHLPGAVFIDLEHCLSGDPRAGRGRHPLPGPATFATGMASAGISDASTVVGYDDQGGVIAARLVWMLRATGHEAALLDGGLQAYGRGLATGFPTVPAGQFSPRPWPEEKLADIAAATSPDNVVVDARPAARYHGEDEHVDPRAGHIPGAVSLPCRENLASDGMFLPVAALRRRFEAAGISPSSHVVSYCGSGVSACHNLLALELCGLGEARLYPGSWSEYSTRYDAPAAT